MFRGDYLYLYRALLDVYNMEKQRTDDVDPRTLRMLVEKVCPKRLWDNRVRLLVDRWEETAPPTGRAEQEVLERFVIQEGLLAVAADIMEKHDFRPAELDPWETQKKLEKLTSFALVPESTRILDYATGDPTQLFREGFQTGRVPVGVGRVDDALDGGLGPGELGILIAPSGGGKTAVLLHLACEAILKGKRVLHITLEIRTIKVAERVTMKISGKTKEEIRLDPEIVKQSMQTVLEAQGGLLIHDLSHEHVSMRRLEGVIARQVPLDLVLVDYADLLGRASRSEDRRAALGDIYRELRRLASAYNVPIWTASQGNRFTMGAEDFGKEHVAEDISKIHTGDVVICLIQTPDEKEDGIMRMKVDKTRESAWNPVVTVRMDYNRMTLTDTTKAGGTDGDTQVEQSREGNGRKLDSSGKGKPRSHRS